jgi:hypothetical protein
MVDDEDEEKESFSKYLCSNYLFKDEADGSIQHIDVDEVPVINTDIARYLLREPSFHGTNLFVNLTKIQDNHGWYYLVCQTIGNGNCCIEAMVKFICKSFRLVPLFKEEDQTLIDVFDVTKSKKITALWSLMVSKFRKVLANFYVHLKASTVPRKEPFLDSGEHNKSTIDELFVDKSSVDSVAFIIFSMLIKKATLILDCSCNGDEIVRRLSVFDSESEENDYILSSAEDLMNESLLKFGEIPCILKTNGNLESNHHMVHLIPVPNEYRPHKISMANPDIRELVWLNAVCNEIDSITDGEALRSFNLLERFLKQKETNPEPILTLSKIEKLIKNEDFDSDNDEPSNIADDPLDEADFFKSFVLDVSKLQTPFESVSKQIKKLKVFKSSLFSEDFSASKQNKSYGVLGVPNLCKLKYKKFLFYVSQTKSFRFSPFDCMLHKICESRRLNFIKYGMNSSRSRGSKKSKNSISNEKFLRYGPPFQKATVTTKVSVEYDSLISLCESALKSWYTYFYHHARDIGHKIFPCLPPTFPETSDCKIFIPIAILLHTAICIMKLDLKSFELTPFVLINCQFLNDADVMKSVWIEIDETNIEEFHKMFKDFIKDNLVIVMYSDPQQSQHPQFSVLLHSAEAQYGILNIEEVQHFKSIFKKKGKGVVVKSFHESKENKISSESKKKIPVYIEKVSFRSSGDDYDFIFDEPHPFSMKRVVAASLDNILIGFFEDNKFLRQKIGQHKIGLMFILLEAQDSSRDGQKNLRIDIDWWLSTITKLSTLEEFDVVFCLPCHDIYESAEVASHLTCINMFSQFNGRRKHKKYWDFFFISCNPSVESMRSQSSKVVHYYYFLKCSQNKSNHWPLQLKFLDLCGSLNCSFSMPWDIFHKESYYPHILSIIAMITISVCFEKNSIWNRNADPMEKFYCLISGLEFDIIPCLFVLIQKISLIAFSESRETRRRGLHFIEPHAPEMYRRFQHALDFLVSFKNSKLSLSQFFPFDARKYSRDKPRCTLDSIQALLSSVKAEECKLLVFLPNESFGNLEINEDIVEFPGESDDERHSTSEPEVEENSEFVDSDESEGEKEELDTGEEKESISSKSMDSATATDSGSDNESKSIIEDSNSDTDAGMVDSSDSEPLVGTIALKRKLNFILSFKIFLLGLKKRKSTFPMKMKTKVFIFNMETFYNLETEFSIILKWIYLVVFQTQFSFHLP